MNVSMTFSIEGNIFVCLAIKIIKVVPIQHFLCTQTLTTLKGLKLRTKIPNVL